MVAVGTFTLARARLVSEAEQTAENQTFRRAIDLRQRLQALPPEQLDPSAEVTVPPTPIDVGTTDGVDPEPPLEKTAPDDDLVVDRDEVLEALANQNEKSDAETSDQVGDEGQPEVTVVLPEPVDAVRFILSSQLNPDDVGSLLVLNDRDRSISGLRENQMPPGVISAVQVGNSAKQLYLLGGIPYVVVGVPITGQDARYYELTSLADLENTLVSLRAILAGTALVASLAGAALGSYSARRALQPLREVSAAAESIALGQFDTRLEAHTDPDLAGLTSSFNDMVDALQTRIERDGRFASDVSHELRSPLMTLAASVGVLEGRRPDLPESARKAVDLLSRDVERFEGLVEDLLEISRMDVGAVELDLSALFLGEFLRFAVAQSRAPDVGVSHRPEDENLVVSADKRHLAQAVSNLLDNAVKYAGGPTGVSYRKLGDRVRIYVDDLGPGVRAEDRTRIFDRFTRADGMAGRRATTGGVGLGLSLVTEHVKLHAGSVWVTDRPDGRNGARFVIELPLGEQQLLDEEMAT
ncbi:MAG: two-component system sensor histidine kinase MtrB [Acidimicrobiales bacterium]|jgi:two-component system sensor histidine kinase MtrB